MRIVKLVFFAMTFTLSCISFSANAVTYNLFWNGPNNYRLAGEFTFDDAKIGQLITSTDLTEFTIEGFQDTTSLGTFSGTPTEFNFNSATGSFHHPLSWNTAGPGIGYLTTQGNLGGSTFISEHLYLDGTSVSGASNSFIFEPSVYATQRIRDIGQSAVHIYTLRIPPGACPHPNPQITGCNNSGDTLPVGSGILYMFAIFDTGSTTVAINSQSASQPSDAMLLSLCRSNADCIIPVDGFLPPLLDLRVWGLGATDPNNNGAPLDQPQREVTDLRVRIHAGPTILGGPLTARTVALIDYTTEIVRNYDFGQVRAPNLTFFSSRTSAPGIPILALELVLERVGDFSTSPTDGASTGPRFQMKNIRIANGDASVDDNNYIFLYDTGNTATQVTYETAIALGIDPDNDLPVDTLLLNTISGTVEVKGYIVDQVSITSVFGDMYRLESPVVYVRPQSVGLGGVDVNVGSNYFNNKKIVFDGPGDRLWITRESYPGPQNFIDNGDGTITDPTSNLMWIKDAGYAATMGQGPNGDGKMTWQDTVSWAEGLSYIGYDDWRLPTTLDPDPNCQPVPNAFTQKNCRGSEMGYLYWEQGVTTVTPGPFLNVPPVDYYWSQTPYTDGTRAWVHSFRHGEQGPANTASSVLLSGWAVRDRLRTDTATGSNISVTPIDGVQIEFENVDAGGATTVTVSSTNPGDNTADLQFLGDFYDIETTADQSGNTTVCLNYPDGTNTSTLELLHWDGSMWVPLEDAEINETDQTICAVIPSLSSKPGSGNDSGTGTDEDNTCPISTAFGSKMHPYVNALRIFRDDYLSTNQLGRQLVDIYYTYSPPIAKMLAKSDSLRFVVRWALTPVVYAILYPITTLCVLFGVIAWLVIIGYKARVNRDYGGA